MDVVFVRTEKGEAEITSRSNQLSHAAWLTLVMVDGRTSTSELVKLKPKLHDVEQSLKLLADGKFIDVAPQAAAQEEAAQEERTPPPTLEAEWGRRERDEEEASHERVAKTRIKRKRKISFAWLRRLVKRTVFAAVIPLFLALAALFLFPLSVYVPHVENMLSQKMQQPVSIAGLRFVLDPRPALVLRQVSVGPQVKIASVRVVPDLTSVHRPVKFISVVELESSTIDASELAKLAPLLKPSDNVRLRTVGFRELKVDVAGITLGPLTAEARLDDESTLEKAVVSTSGLNAEVTPTGKDYSVKITGKNWRLPIAPSLLLESLTATGTASENALSLPKMEAALHGGTANGGAHLNWSGGWSAEGSYLLKNLNIETLVPVFSQQFSTSGSLSGEYRFAAKSHDLASLLESPRADANFRVTKGVLQNVDIVETIKNARSTRGGKTYFDELTGSAALENDAYQFRQCKLTSGVVTVVGQFDISAADKLSGRLNVEFKPNPTRGTMAMQITGTLSDPVLKPLP
jgi:hypothetical protein